MTAYVLFVDDEPENLDVFEAICVDHFPVLTATSGAEALSLMRTHEVAVLLTDQRMPLMTGLELLERTQVEHPRVVRMLITAHSDLTTAIAAINRGRVRRYLKKPWDPDELIATIADGFDFYQMRAKLNALERRLAETERVYALGVIAAGLARELESPVNALCECIGRARALIRPSTEPPSSDGRAATWRRVELVSADSELDEAERAARRLLVVARGVGVPSRDSATEATEVSEVTHLTLRLLQSELRGFESLGIECPPAPLVKASSAQVGQVAMNLLLNAVAAVAGLPPKQRRLRVRLTHDREWVSLEFVDSGPAPGDGDLLDEEFYPLSRRGETKRGYDMGLAIVKTILQEVDGRLEAERIAAGVTYRAYFPRSDRVQELSTEPPVVPAFWGMGASLVRANDGR